MLSPGDGSYREWALTRLDQIPGMDFARYYWRREFPELLRDRSRTLEVLDPPLNKLRRLLSTPQVDVVLRHPYSLDIEGAIARGEVIVVNGAKAVAGEDNTKLLFQLLLRLVHRAIQAQQAAARERASQGVALRRRGPQRAHPLGRHPARRGPLRRTRGVLRLAVLGPDPRRAGALRACARCCSRSRSSACARWRTPARSPGSRWTSTATASRSTRKNRNGCASRPTTSSTCPSTPPSTSGSPAARRAPAFVAGTLPMQDLYDPALAEHHLAAQRDRGGHYPAHLPAPLGDKRSADAHRQNGAPRRPGPNGDRSRRSDRRATHRQTAQIQATVQLLLEDL